MKISVAFLAGLLTTVATQAQLFTISVSGTITAINHDGGTLPSQIMAGEPWSGTFTYDVGTTADQNVLGNVGDYRPTNAPNGFQFSIGDAGDNPLVPGDTTFTVRVVDGGANDEITISTDHNWSHTDPANGAITYQHDGGHTPHIFLQSDQNPISSDGLPTGGLNISQFNLANTFTFGSFYDPPGPLVNASHQIVGTVDSVSVSIGVVPEPEHYAAVVALSLLFVAIARRRSLTQAV